MFYLMRVYCNWFIVPYYLGCFGVGLLVQFRTKKVEGIKYVEQCNRSHMSWSLLLHTGKASAVICNRDVVICICFVCCLPCRISKGYVDA